VAYNLAQETFREYDAKPVSSKDLVALLEQAAASQEVGAGARVDELESDYEIMIEVEVSG
jgi:hypothetical protein